MSAADQDELLSTAENGRAAGVAQRGAGLEGLMVDPQIAEVLSGALAGNWSTEETVKRLVEVAGGRRGLLEEARNELVHRLQRSAFDTEASKALKMVQVALGRIGYSFEPFHAGPTGRKLLPPALRKF